MKATHSFVMHINLAVIFKCELATQWHVKMADKRVKMTFEHSKKIFFIVDTINTTFLRFIGDSTVDENSTFF